MQQVALREVDAHAAQAFQHRRLVDEFGHRLHAQHLRHVGEAAHGGFVEWVVDHVAHELPVDLQKVDRQRLQIAERRRAGAEVVERHAHAHGAHLVDEDGRVGHVRHRGGLGDFQAQPGAQMRAGLGQQVECPAVERAVADRLSGQVDAEHFKRGLRGHGLHPVDGPPEHPAVDARSQVKALGGRQEGARQHHRSVGLLHAQQHFGMQAGGAAAQWRDALCVERETVFVERLFDARGPLHFELPLVHRAVGVEPGMHPVATGFLGRVARGVGGLLNRHRGGPALVHRHQADAGADAKAALFVDEAEIVHAVADLLRHALSLFGRAVLQDDGELVSAQPRQRVAVAYRLAQQLGHLLQKLVAHRMAAGVVDELELVEVDVQQRVMACIFVRLRQHALQPDLELGAVDQAGHRVVGGAVAHFAGQPPLLAHVVEHQHRAEHVAALVSNRRGRVFDAVFAAVARDQQGLVRQAHHLAALQAAGDGVGRRLARGFVDDVKHLHQRAPFGLGHQPAGEPFCHRVEPGDVAARIGGDDGVADRCQRHPQQRPFFGQRGGHAPLFGDVPVGAGHAQHAAVGIAAQARGAAQVVHAAVGPDHAEFGIEWLAPAHRRPHGLLCGRQVVRVDTALPQFCRVGAAVLGMTEQAVHPGVPERRLAAEVPVPDADAAAVGGQRHALVGKLQRDPLGDAFGHVLKGADQPHRLAVCELGRADGAHPDALAIGADQRQLQVPGLAGGDGRLHGRIDQRAGFGRVELDGAFQLGLVAGLDAVDAAGFVGPDKLLLHEVEFPTADAGQLAGASEEGFALAQRRFMQLALGDVERHRAVAHAPALRVHVGDQVLLIPAVASLNGGMNFELPRLAAQRRVEVVLDLGVDRLAAKLALGSADQARRGGTVDTSKMFVDEGAAVRAIVVRDDGRQVVGDGAQPALGLQQRRLLVVRLLRQRRATAQLAAHQHERNGHPRDQRCQCHAGRAHDVRDLRQVVVCRVRQRGQHGRAHEQQRAHQRDQRETSHAEA